MAGDLLPIRVVKALVRRRKPPTQELIDPPETVNVPPRQFTDQSAGQGMAPGANQRPVVVVFNQNLHLHAAPPPAAPAPTVINVTSPPPAAPPLIAPRPRLFRPSVTAELIERARKMRPDAVMLLLRSYYPMVYRLAAGLTGREKTALKVARLVVNRSLRAMPRWHAPAEAENWFLRNTVQCARQHLPAQSGGKEDALANGDGNQWAFVRGLRGLPFQQVEAFVLQFGERLDIRVTAIAMDCSMTATANHLGAAKKSLQAMAGEEFDHRAASLADSYALLEPAAQLVQSALNWPVRRRLAVRRLVRLCATAILLGIIAGAAYLAWKIVPQLSY